MTKIIASLLLTIFLFGCSASQSDLVDETLQSTVIVFNTPPETPVNPDVPDEKKGGGLGTGFVIGENLIVTNNHVIEGVGDTITVLGHDDLKIYKAEVIASDKTADIALLKLEDWDEFKKHVKPRILSWGDSRKLRTGETVWSMGNPYGLGWTVAQGIISHKQRALGNGRYFLQTTTAIYPGNSGGPLLDENGDVIAVNSAIVGREGYFGMGIPAEVAKKVVKDLLEHKKVQYARLGIMLKPMEKSHYVQVAGIDLDSKAIDAGLLPNDIVHRLRTAYTGHWIDVNTPDDLIYEMQLMSPGDMVELQIERDGKFKELKFPALAKKDS